MHIFLILFFLTGNAFADAVKISDTKYQKTRTVIDTIDMDEVQAAIKKEQSEMAAHDAEAARLATYYEDLHNIHLENIAKLQAKFDEGEAVGAKVTDVVPAEEPPAEEPLSEEVNP